MKIGVDPDRMHFGIRKNPLECGSVEQLLLQDNYIAMYSLWKCFES